MTGALALLLLGPPAHALDGTDAEEPDPVDAAEEDVAGEERPTWGGLVIPLIGATTVDGFGFGVGGEIFRRPAGDPSGYDLKLTPSFYLNTRLDYTNDFVRVERQTRTNWLGTVGYQQWANLAYVGQGGKDVILDLGAAELGSTLRSPYAFVGVSAPVADLPIAAFAQVYVRGALVEPEEGGLLDADRPFGVDGGVYADMSVGVERRRVDRWPVPHRGHHLEASLRGGGTWTAGRVSPLGGLQVEGFGWTPLIGDRLVLAGRLLADKSVGRKPFFEQDKAAGRWRDELGSEQALAGYGRTRTRGDGVVAGLVELRPTFFTVHRGWFDLGMSMSLTAELGWLFDVWDPGPPLPTLGTGVVLLWQQAVQLRPFVAWGWRTPDPSEPRRPALQFGISIMDAL